MMTGNRLCGLSLLALVTLSSPWSAWGQQVIEFEEDTIRGEIEKPEAYIGLSPTNLSYQPLDAASSFLEELYETVKRPPL
jgi:hypothetical protein